MSRLSPKARPGILAGALLPLLVAALTACGSPPPTPTTRPVDVPTVAAQPPTPTSVVSSPGGSNDSTTGTSGAGSLADVSAWGQVSHDASGTTYSYRYPPGWTPDLSYCAPGAARTASGSLLPARCASTDILIGQKARDLGTLTGTNITLDGKQAVKQIDRAPRNGQAELIYTLLVYDPTGTPLAGFSTSVGPNTDTATANNIVATLDQVAGTFVVTK